MNNRVQQRFDASIRTALDEVRVAKERREAERRAVLVAKATERLPLVEARIMEGRYASQDVLALLKRRRSQYRQTLGHTLDRACREIPTLGFPSATDTPEGTP